MERINEVVIRQLKLRKGGEATLPLWEEIWASYQKGAPDGIDALLAQLLGPDTKSG
jgi:hypothetical protein